MDIRTVSKLEKKAAKISRDDFLRIGLALFFLVAVLWYSFGIYGDIPNNAFLAIGALFGAYMAINIGANDVANNVGPAVGSKALTLGGAIMIAAIFETSGALIAGGDVVSTIKKGIIDPSAFADIHHFIWAMTSALLAGGLWLNLATILGAPVSTTHSIVGGVMGAGIAASGFGIVNWGTMGAIAASWVVSPVMGGVIAAAFLYSIKKTVIYKEDRLSAMVKVAPLYVAFMTWAFVTYLTLKGFGKVWPSIVEIFNSSMFFSLPDTKKPPFIVALIFGLIVAAIVLFIVKPIVKEFAGKLENTRGDVNRLFTVPLIFAAAMLSFAHGANDVANAIGPLAAITDAVQTNVVNAKAPIPIWVMLVGALGISLGLMLYGPKLIRTVGSEITELDQVRAYSIAMAAAITVIIASQLGLPVSSTHIAVGGVFGVGFLREFLSNTKEEEEIRKETQLVADEQRNIKTYNAELSTLEAKDGKVKEDYQHIAELYRLIDIEEDRLKAEKKALKQAEKVKYVKRDAIKKIVAAWLITVPTAAIIAACIFYMIRGFML